jgi:hypothetical protein
VRSHTTSDTSDSRTLFIQESIVVYVCKAFAEVALRQPAVAEAMLIHEVLHTLGLGEAPMPGQPTSLEITQRVQSRCR